MQAELAAGRNQTIDDQQLQDFVQPTASRSSGNPSCQNSSRPTTARKPEVFKHAPIPEFQFAKPNLITITDVAGNDAIMKTSLVFCMSCIAADLDRIRKLLDLSRREKNQVKPKRRNSGYRPLGWDHFELT